MTVSAAVLNYEAGNVRSAQRALQRAGADAFVTGDVTAAEAADLLVIPGVGHFGQCARHFRAAGFEDLVRRWLDHGRPLLGICVGMQILYPSSDEDPTAEGLGLLPGHVRRLPGDVVVPHMGWDTVRVIRDDPAVAGLDGQRCYFTHSYYADPADDDHVVAVCDYGPGFPCVVRTRSALGLQFHPEKSSHVGAAMLRNLITALAGGEGGREAAGGRGMWGEGGREAAGGRGMWGEGGRQAAGREAAGGRGMWGEGGRQAAGRVAVESRP